ncbi:hypothetical protein DPMN_164997 [Dreissena polymorpha]|uniref:Uncharacterized protein n=1 Tax=Dreissena polymorpha TaxID=45954 RepID=A0A9D4EWV5_DREPO|nr:hypothetical protein DPMN_164997 [Dreissena polymorpha]
MSAVQDLEKTPPTPLLTGNTYQLVKPKIRPHRHQHHYSKQMLGLHFSQAIHISSSRQREDTTNTNISISN